jgi:hypothetical protein
MNSQMNVISAQWNHDGSILAIGGIQMIEEKEVNVVQFYTPWGKVRFKEYFNYIRQLGFLFQLTLIWI